MKTNKKQKRRILWERVISMITIILFGMCFIHHVKLNGFYLLQIVEIIQYLLLTSMVYVTVKDFRTNPENWKF